MLYFTQLIYLQDGKETIFHLFEEKVLPILTKYNGKLLLRIRPDENSFIEVNMARPYEIHLVAFESEQDFVSYSRDETRQQFLHLKEQSVRESILIRGWAFPKT